MPSVTEVAKVSDKNADSSDQVRPLPPPLTNDLGLRGGRKHKKPRGAEQDEGRGREGRGELPAGALLRTARPR